MLAHEPGAEGLPQAVIPGAEREPLRVTLERRMQGAKRAPRTQKAPDSDGGLFDTNGRAQGVLF